MSSIFGPVPILVLLAIQILLIRNVSSQNITNEYLNHKCNNTQGNYRPGSVFEKNLNQVIRQISTLDLKKGFAYISNVRAYKITKEPNMVFVLLQCRGDSYGPKCHSCLNIALSGLRKRCPGNKGAIIWYDQCLLDISSVDSEGRIHYENDFWLTNPKNASGNTKLFEEKRQALMDKLILEASKKSENGKGPLYAAGDTRLGAKKLYAMVQCTQDLWENGCHVCQEWINNTYQDCCEGKAGARILGRSCSLRYEFYPFLRTHRLL